MGNLLLGKGMIRADDGVIRAGPLANFEMQKHHQNKHKFKVGYLRNNVATPMENINRDPLDCFVYS